MFFLFFVFSGFGVVVFGALRVQGCLEFRVFRFKGLDFKALVLRA